MRRERFGEVLAAACAAIVVHALIGLYQVYSFAHDEFPLLFLYRNPSFKSMEAVEPRLRRLHQAALRPVPRAVGDGRVAGSLARPAGRPAPRSSDTSRPLGWRGGPAAAVALARRLRAGRPVSIRLDLRHHGVDPGRRASARCRAGPRLVGVGQVADDGPGAAGCPSLSPCYAAARLTPRLRRPDVVLLGPPRDFRSGRADVEHRPGQPGRRSRPGPVDADHPRSSSPASPCPRTRTSWRSSA